MLSRINCPRYKRPSLVGGVEVESGGRRGRVEDMAGRKQVHSRIQRKSECGKVIDMGVARNLGSPLGTIPDFAGVVVVDVSVVKSARGHHATVVQFGYGWIPAPMCGRSHIHQRL